MKLKESRARKNYRFKFLAKMKRINISVRTRSDQNLDKEIQGYLEANEILSQRAKAIEEEMAELEKFKALLENQRVELAQREADLERRERELEENRAQLVETRSTTTEPAPIKQQQQQQYNNHYHQPLRQLQSTIREDSSENDENNSPVYHTPEADRKLSKCRTIDEEIVLKCDSSPMGDRNRIELPVENKMDASEDDLIPRQTPPRSYPRQSIGQWSVERVRNNMSVRSLVSSLEGQRGTRSGAASASSGRKISR